MLFLCLNRSLTCIICIYYLLTGERALRSVLEDAMRIADRCTNPNDRESIIKAVGDIQSMVDALAELRAQGKVCVQVYTQGHKVWVQVYNQGHNVWV